MASCASRACKTPCKSTARGRAPGTSVTHLTRARPRRRGRAASRSAALPARSRAPTSASTTSSSLQIGRTSPTLGAVPANARSKLHLLRDFDPASARAGDLDVPDPYYGGDEGFEHVLDLVEAACRGLLESLRADGRL